MESKTVFHVYTHGVTVINPNPAIQRLLYMLARNYTQSGLVYDEGLRKKVWKPIKTFLTYAEHGKRFYLHINQYRELKKLLIEDAIPSVLYEEIVMPAPVSDAVDLPVRPHWELYPEQVDALNFVVEESHIPGNTSMVMMPTGTGKGVTSMSAASILGKRIVVFVLATYLEKWKKELQEVYDITEEDICVIQGSKDLKNALAWPASSKPLPKIFIFSISTYNNYLKQYEEDSQDPRLEAYDCTPEEMCSHLGIGTAIFDEAHQHPHVIYRIITHLHVQNVITLSATLLSLDPVLQRVQRMMFPAYRRYEKVKARKYIACTACQYQIHGFKQTGLRTTEFGSNSYSHTAFEKSILTCKNRKVTQQYLAMIMGLVKDTYIAKYMDGDKLAIFVATEKMAKRVCHELRDLYPHLDIRTKLYADPFENAIEPDIRVTTILSCGTAVDIPNLRVVIMTNSVDSPIQNVQTLGRLRFLKDRDTFFYYLFCANIPKQVEYHENKKLIFMDRVLTHKEIALNPIYP